jgi:hypothetical protein
VSLPYKVAEFQETPNPNAVKCILDPPAPPISGEGMRSYQSLDAGAHDPLAAPVLGIAGVVGVFISQGWLTVSKAPKAEWKPIKAALKKVLANAP